MARALCSLYAVVAVGSLLVTSANPLVRNCVYKTDEGLIDLSSITQMYVIGLQIGISIVY